MADDGQNTRERTSSEFVDDTVLESFVPTATEINLHELLEQWDGDIPEGSSSIVPFIAQRPFLFIDELVPVFIVLRTRVLGEDELETYLSRLAITLEARAVGTPNATKLSDVRNATAPLQVNELLFSQTIKDSEEPTICATEVQSDDETESAQFLYVFWKVLVPLARPKAQIQKLGIYFAASASLKPVEAMKVDEADYMPSLVPQSVNLLQPFASDPALGGLTPKLSASKVTRARPISATTPVAKKMVRPLRTGPRKLFRAAPGFLWRVRFTKSPSTSQPYTTIASLDLEITPFSGSDVSIETMGLSLSSGVVETIGPRLPIRCRTGDQVTLLYRLTPHTSDSTLDTGAPQTLTIKASATVLNSKTCRPEIKIDWTTPVELPSSRQDSKTGSKVPSKPLGPDSLPITDETTVSNSSNTVTNGVSLTVTGPPGVEVGQVFKWHLFVINRSDKVHRLAVLAIPKRRVTNAVNSRRNSTSSFIAPTANKDSLTFADAVIDEQSIFTSQRNAVMEPMELICLSPDVRVGPLAPAACFSTELKFIALASGVLYLESLRVVDLNTQDATDIRDVPDIVAVEKTESQREDTD